jgi:hypothetical protein
MGQVDDRGPTSQFSGETSGLIHRAESELRRLKLEAGSRTESPKDLSSVILAISGTSIREIDKLISELHSLCDYLLKEGQRLQQEISENAQLNQGAVRSTSVITETLQNWKTRLGRSSQTGSHM